MNPIRNVNVEFALPLGVMVLLATWLAFLLARPTVAPSSAAVTVETTPTADAPAKGLAVPASRVLPASEYDEIRARPLFAETRRPSEAVRPAATPTAAAETLRALQASLIGVVINGDERIVLLRGERGETVRVRQGDAWSGWRLSSVSRESIELENGDMRQQLQLERRGGQTGPSGSRPAGKLKNKNLPRPTIPPRTVTPAAPEADAMPPDAGAEVAAPRELE